MWEPEAVSTAYIVNRCTVFVVSNGGTVECVASEKQVKETVPFVPGFTYNYQVSFQYYMLLY